MLERISRLGCRRAIKLRKSRRTRSYAAHSAQVLLTSPNSRNNRRSKHPPRTAADLGVLHRIHERVLSVRGVILQLLCRVLLPEPRLAADFADFKLKLHTTSKVSKYKIAQEAKYGSLAFLRCLKSDLAIFRDISKSRCEGLVQLLGYWGIFCWFCG